MQPEGLLPHLQVPATCPYPEPDQSSPCPQLTFWDPLIIILPPTSKCSKWTLSSRFPHQNPLSTSHPPLIRATSPVHNSYWFDRPNNICWGYRSLSSSFSSFLHSHVTSFFFGSNILVSTLFLNTLSLRFSLNVTDQVSHPYKTKGKIMLLKQLLHYLQALPLN
jgi:hypothetical protein